MSEQNNALNPQGDLVVGVDGTVESFAALRWALNTRNFYLTADGLCFYYPLCAVAGAKEGIVTYTMPYDDACGPFVPPIG